MEIRAAVVRKKGGPFELEALQLEEPRRDEVLIRVVATGMCHTDMVARDQLYDVPLPIVLGHEGAGIVERIGSDVRKVAAGDHVVLTYMYRQAFEFLDFGYGSAIAVLLTLLVFALSAIQLRFFRNEATA